MLLSSIHPLLGLFFQMSNYKYFQGDVFPQEGPLYFRLHDGAFPLPIYVLTFAEYLISFCFVAGCHSHSEASPPLGGHIIYTPEVLLTTGRGCAVQVSDALHHPSSHSQPDSLKCVPRQPSP